MAAFVTVLSQWTIKGILNATLTVNDDPPAKQQRARESPDVLVAREWPGAAAYLSVILDKGLLPQGSLSSSVQ